MPAVSIKGLKKRYPSGVEALKGVNLDIAEGDYFALLGPNGAGKTTIINILTSLVQKTDGSVTIFGYDIDRDFAKAKALIGVVPQEMNFSIFETVNRIVVDQAGYYGIPPKIAAERAEHYLRQLGLWDKRNAMSRSLSGGMKRRLMIARALIHQPKLLILDEPTAGVDVELRRSTWEFLQKINADGVTIILTTHYLEEAESQCNSIAIIDHGEIIENTKMSQFLNALDYDTVILNLGKPYEHLPVIDGFRIAARDDLTLIAEVPKDRTMSKLFQELERLNIVVNSVQSKTNRLEELYINKTKRDKV